MQSYNVSIVPTADTAPTIDIIVDSDLSTCRDVCTYVFQMTSEMIALNYSVFVSAKNILLHGYGQRTVCNNQIISKQMKLLVFCVGIMMNDYSCIVIKFIFDTLYRSYK